MKTSDDYKTGWIIYKKYGHIHTIQWALIDNNITIRPLPNTPAQVPEFFDTELFKDEPYETDYAYVFTDEIKMCNWIREEAKNMTSKLQHYFGHLHTFDSYFNWIKDAAWPENFELGHIPNDYRNYTRVHIPRFKTTENNVQSVIAHAESIFGMPLEKFKRVYARMDYNSYDNRVDITLAINIHEQYEYFKQHALSEDKARSAIEYVINSKCPSLRYNLNIYRTPRFYYGDDKYLVDTTDENFSDAFFKAVGHNIKTKLGVATRKKDVPKTNICAYLVSDDMMDKIPRHIAKSSIMLPYSYVTHKCYAVYAPININMWCRPDNTIIIDTMISTGTASLTKFKDSISSMNILDQLLDMPI